MDMDDLIVQYCDGDQDITASPYAEMDATEVRVWTPTGDLVMLLTPEDRGWSVQIENGEDPEWFSSVEDAINSL